MKVQTTILRQESLAQADREAMVCLYQQYFSSVVNSTFQRDLEEKQWVILLHSNGVLGGFSTAQLFILVVDGSERVCLFSGDTIVDRKFWNSPALAGSFGQLILKALEIAGDRELYWFLISKGYRTYRFLPVFFHEFYPRFDKPTPHRFQEVLDAVSISKFGGAYDRGSGIVRASAKKDRLRQFMQKIPAGREADPHIRFFLQKNPGHTQGDELACIASLRRDNLNKAAWRVIRTTPVVWEEQHA